MRFWDASALVPWFAAEARSFEIRQLLTEDEFVVTSFLTQLEIRSALWRRAGANNELRQPALQQFERFQRRWVYVSDFDAVLRTAGGMIAAHRLRTGDAVQLASAVVVSPDRRMPFVTLDTDLAAAARAEGFPILR